MRVTGGVVGRREIRVPKTDVRPTQDKVRAAICSALATVMPGSRVLDLFAGTGALGIEAWSRGASHVTWVEGDRRVFAVLKDNVDSLCGGPGGEASCRLQQVGRFLETASVDRPFDLILADPPYDREGRTKWLEAILDALEKRALLAPDGVLVFEQSSEEEPAARAGWVLIRDRTYGGTRVVMYKRPPPAGPSGPG